MAETPCSQLLANQHHQIDAGVKGIAEGGSDLPALARSLALLRLHVYVEEAILFPPLVKSGLTMPVFVMKREHGQMWPLLESLAAASAKAAAEGTMREDGRKLYQLLQMHNPKEESIVYTALDRLQAQPAEPSFATAIQAAQLPEGWRCALAPKQP
ncbi:MAG: hemerythrin domain-containing protein [Rhodanobacteraceae bacterium]|nr:MAG: hemerythrin domain-containing protein [Rhodanobacteraceae bacterium]